MNKIESVEHNFFEALPEMTVNASNGAIVKIAVNIILQREEDSLRKFASWIESSKAGAIHHGY